MYLLYLHICLLKALPWFVQSSLWARELSCREHTIRLDYSVAKTSDDWRKIHDCACRTMYINAIHFASYHIHSKHHPNYSMRLPSKWKCIASFICSLLYIYTRNSVAFTPRTQFIHEPKKCARVCFHGYIEDVTLVESNLPNRKKAHPIQLCESEKTAFFHVYKSYFGV